MFLLDILFTKNISLELGKLLMARRCHRFGGTEIISQHCVCNSLFTKNIETFIQSIKLRHHFVYKRFSMALGQLMELPFCRAMKRVQLLFSVTSLPHRFAIPCAFLVLKCSTIVCMCLWRKFLSYAISCSLIL